MISTIVSILSMLFIYGLYYLWLPPLSLAYFSGCLFIFICGLVVALNISVWIFRFNKGTKNPFYIPLQVFVAEIAIIVIGTLAGSAIFNSDTMYRQLGEVEIVQFDEMVKQMDTAQIPIVDEELAKKQADKKIGEDVALGSRVELDDPAIQEVNGEIVFVTPLKHSGFFKWRTYKTTPGYITVSASNPNKVNYVTEVDGEKIEVLYQTSAFFENNLKRHIRNSGYRKVGLTEYTFEIDDEGHPYWVVTTYKNKTLWGSPEATGVVIVDAQNGKTEWYACDEIPEWVDIVQPREFIETQIDNWGTLVHGPINMANKDKIKKTDLTIPVYVEGDCYYFTGMTSVGKDESCVGFIMVNTRNKKAVMSYMSGATESAAMKSAEGLVSDFGYVSSEPLPLNVNGIPTYVMSLKDEELLIKNYAMVNINNYGIAAKGNSLAETMRNYMQAVAKSGTTYAVGSAEVYGYTYEGIVQRISSVVEEGSTYYYIVVEEEPEKIFTASYIISDELAVTRDGDTVRIEYVDNKNGTVDITNFDNIAFSTPVSDNQQRRNELDEGTSVLESEYNQIIKVNPELNKETWDNMTEEEKSKMLEEFLSKKS